jgi:hypothetical protein
MNMFLALVIIAAGVAFFFFRKGVKNGAYSRDRTYGGAVRSIFSARRMN